jgi:NADH-quinone oxidoreductase subunit K
MTAGLEHYLTVSALLFGLGLYAVLTRRNAVALLMGVELILNAANLNFVAFARFVDGGVDGHIMAAFVIVLAMFRNFGTVHVDTVNRLKR